MRILLLLVLWFGFFTMSGEAQTYSCRDSKGQLHFSDNLQGLPAECLGQTRDVKPGKADNLNYVPAIPDPQESSHEFKQSVRDAEQEEVEKKLTVKQLSTRVDVLLQRYRTAMEDKHRARRAWDNSSRQKIKLADDEIAEVRAEKQRLLREVEKLRLPSGEKVEIVNKLKEITAE